MHPASRLIGPGASLTPKCCPSNRPGRLKSHHHARLPDPKTSLGHCYCWPVHWSVPTAVRLATNCQPAWSTPMPSLVIVYSAILGPK
ncbi:hypothetical protein NL676_010792 [Syzygium grande]|nr:hypothetical protein NL676_010792 [Syzygium grande]